MNLSLDGLGKAGLLRSEVLLSESAYAQALARCEEGKFAYASLELPLREPSGPRTTTYPPDLASESSGRRAATAHTVMAHRSPERWRAGFALGMTDDGNEIDDDPRDTTNMRRQRFIEEELRDDPDLPHHCEPFDLGLTRIYERELKRLLHQGAGYRPEIIVALRDRVTFGLRDRRRALVLRDATLRVGVSPSMLIRRGPHRGRFVPSEVSAEALHEERRSTRR
jgi:hypothetical protein